MRPVGQDVVRAGDVVAQRLGRVRAEEGGAGMADGGEMGFRLGEHDLQVFGCEAVGQCGGLGPVAHDDDGAVGLPGGAGDGGAGERWQFGLHGGGDFAGEGGIGGDQDGLGGVVVLGLGEQVYCDQARWCGGVGQDHDF